MSLNWTALAYIGFGSAGGGGGNNIIIINENGLVPIQEVDFDIEIVAADVELGIQEFTFIYDKLEEFTLFLEEENQ